VPGSLKKRCAIRTSKYLTSTLHSSPPYHIEIVASQTPLLAARSYAEAATMTLPSLRDYRVRYPLLEVGRDGLTDSNMNPTASHEFL